jgi:hypothetical protein
MIAGVCTNWGARETGRACASVFLLPLDLGFFAPRTAVSACATRRDDHLARASTRSLSLSLCVSLAGPRLSLIVPCLFLYTGGVQQKSPRAGRPWCLFVNVCL